MTIQKVIDKVLELKEGMLDEADIIECINEVELRATYMIINQSEDGKNYSFTPYTSDTDKTTILLIPSPWDSLYVDYTCSQADYNFAEYQRYNNEISMFNAKFKEYDNYYRMEHKPKKSTAKFNIRMRKEV